MSTAFRQQPYRDVVDALSRQEAVPDETDVNNDASFHVLVGEQNPLLLRLSVVGPYAMLEADLGSPTPSLIEPAPQPVDDRATAVLRVLTAAGIKLLSSGQLSTHIALRVPDVAEVRVYNALFAPEDDLRHPTGAAVDPMLAEVEAFLPLLVRTVTADDGMLVGGEGWHYRINTSWRVGGATDEEIGARDRPHGDRSRIRLPVRRWPGTAHSGSRARRSPWS